MLFVQLVETQLSPADICIIQYIHRYCSSNRVRPAPTSRLSEQLESSPSSCIRASYEKILSESQVFTYRWLTSHTSLGASNSTSDSRNGEFGKKEMGCTAPDTGGGLEAWKTVVRILANT